MWGVGGFCRGQGGPEGAGGGLFQQGLGDCLQALLAPQHSPKHSRAGQSMLTPRVHPPVRQSLFPSQPDPRDGLPALGQVDAVLSFWS